MKKIIVLVKDPDRQYEALRTSLGALLEMAEVSMVVLDHEIGSMDEAYSENMEFLDEMEGLRFSNNQVNVDKYGFQPANQAEIGDKIKESDIVIPF
ncbi:MAG: hypothetical protein K9K64_10730 [Desulfohalobiaceae bacterium]|nr:hypothetical protein [Desulfohalobiaceae bacterium]